MVSWCRRHCVAGLHRGPSRVAGPLAAGRVGGPADGTAASTGPPGRPRSATCRLLPAALADRGLPPSATCGLPPAACHLLPAAVCYLRPSICCPSRPLPSVCRPLSAAFRLLSATMADRHLPHQPSAGPAHPQLHPRCHRFGPSTRLSASLRHPSATCPRNFACNSLRTHTRDDPQTAEFQRSEFRF